MMLTFKSRGTKRSREVTISGTITIGASGAVSSQSSEAATTVKTSAKTGRYTVTFDRKYKNCRVGSLTLEGPADTGLTATDGNELFARNVTGSGFDIQARQTSYADANPASGSVIHWAVRVQE